MSILSRVVELNTARILAGKEIAANGVLLTRCVALIPLNHLSSKQIK